MPEILYQLYNVTLSSASHKNILKALKKQPFTHALISGKRISFANKAGVSYQEVCIDALEGKNFVYLSPAHSKKLFLLIYINSKVVYSGLVESREIDNKLDLYKTRFGKETRFYTKGFEHSFKFLPKAEPVDPRIDRYRENEKYQLLQISTIQQTLNKPYRLAGVVVIAVVCVLVAALLAMQYNKYRKKQAQQHKVQQQIDLWKGYRNALIGSAVDTEFNAVFKKIITSTLLPNTAIKNLDYKDHQLKIELVNFNYPTRLLQQWATKHALSVRAFGAEKIILAGFIHAPLQKSDEIINIDQTKAWLIDSVHNQFPRTLVAFKKEVKHSNYGVLTTELKFYNTPIELINQFMHQAHALPIRLGEITGSVTFGNFSGSIHLKVIGGIS